MYQHRETYYDVRRIDERPGVSDMGVLHDYGEHD
jgi:hypothetical protein